MAYDTTNIFARILRGEIPCGKLYEDEFAFAFNDIAPSAPTHILVIPKGEYASYDQFISRASDAQILGFFRAVQKIAKEAGGDFRLITNNGEGAGQTVHHFHVHIIGGRPLGALVGD